MATTTITTTTTTTTNPSTNHDRAASSGRDLLLDVACDLFLEHGFDAVSIQQIVSAAQMTKASPYYHFKNKDDLFVHAFFRLTDGVFAGVTEALAREGDLRARLIAGFTYLLEFTHPGIPRFFEDFRRVVTRTGMEAAVREAHDERRFQQVYVAMFAQAVEGGLALTMPPERAAALLESFQMGVIFTQRVRMPEVEPADAARLATEVIDCFLNGALARP